MLNHVVAHELQGEDYDGLGQFLGGNFNLLVDFPHSRIIACDTFSKLREKKLAGEHWVRVPFEMHRSGILLNASTNSGTYRLVINTTCTLTNLRSSLIPSDHPTDPSLFSLGGYQLDNVVFRPIDLPEGLSDIDGFIGMDFLKKHVIYIDYKNKTLYIAPPERYFERIPITFVSRGHPTVDVSIDGNVYPLEVDLGCSFPFFLNQKILQNVHKTSYGTAKWIDFRGHRYESPAYEIPEIKIGNLIFSDQIVKQNREDFHINVRLEGPAVQPLGGVVGRPILEKYNLFLDFPHSAMYASSDTQTLQEAGLLSYNLLAVPFATQANGVIFSVETDAGVYRFMLDTGGTWTAIRAPHQDYTKKFCMMGYDFGGCFIKAIDLTPEFGCDGFLGMDFLLEYPCFIDYSNKVVFIDLQKGPTKARAW